MADSPTNTKVISTRMFIGFDIIDGGDTVVLKFIDATGEVAALILSRETARHAAFALDSAGIIAAPQVNQPFNE